MINLQTKLSEIRRDSMAYFCNILISLLSTVFQSASICFNSCFICRSKNPCFVSSLRSRKYEILAREYRANKTTSDTHLLDIEVKTIVK